MKEKSEKWSWELERQMHPFIWWHIGLRCVEGRTFRKFPVGNFVVFQELKANLYWNNINIVKNANYSLKRIVNPKDNFLKEYRLEIKREEKEIREFGKELLRLDYSKMPVTKLCQLIKRYSKLYRQHGVGVIRDFNKLGADKLIEFLEKSFPPEKIQSYLAVLAAPSKKSAFEKEKEDLKKITDDKLLDTHVRKYNYLTCGYTDEEPLKKQDFIKRLKALQTNAAPKKERSSRIKLLKKLKAPFEIKRISRALSEFTYYKDHVRGYYNFLHYASRPLFEECARQLGINLTQLKMLMPYEIISSLKSGKIDKKLIQERYKLCVIHMEGKTKEVLIGQKAKRFIKENIPAAKAGLVESITGMCANPGYVSGRVKIVKTIKDVGKKDKDFILVTPMTTPELVPAAHRAKAIVTDEGGITCHAAIVSREINKPCIIGTKIATKVLRDGDLVEVDANKGIVKVLKK